MTDAEGNRRTASTDPLQHMLELMLYAPIGLLTVAQKELPQLIATGKRRVDNQLTLAKFIGKMAVRQGRAQLKRRLDEAEQARREAGRGATPASQHEVIEAHAVEGIGDADLATSLPETIIEMVAKSPLLAVPPAADLPIEGYDSLAASQVVGRLGSLNDAELTAIEAYETANRARRTILGKIHQLRAE